MEIVRLAIAGVPHRQIAEQYGTTANNIRQIIWRQMAKYRQEVEQVRDIWGYRIERLVEKAWPLAMEGDPQGMDQMIRLVGMVGRIYDMRPKTVVETTNVFVLPGQRDAVGQLTVDDLRKLAQAVVPQAELPVSLPAPAEMIDVTPEEVGDGGFSD